MEMLGLPERCKKRRAGQQVKGQPDLSIPFAANVAYKSLRVYSRIVGCLNWHKGHNGR